MPQDSHERSAAWRYGMAVLAVTAAVLVTRASQEFGLANRSAAFLAAVLLTGWYAGTGPLVLALVLSTLAFDYFFLLPLHTLGPQWSSDPYLAWFLLFALLASWFSTARRRSERLLKQARSELEERVIARTAELQRSEMYLVAAQELSHTGSWAGRIATGEGSCSAETLRILGLDPSSPTPTYQQVRRSFHPDDLELVDETLEAGIREKRDFQLDVRIVRPDGSIRFVHGKGQPVLNDAGEVVALMGVVMDVTDRKRAERALRRSRERTLEARFAAVLDERTRLARDLHDTLLQGFTGVSLQLVAATNRLTGQPETSAALTDVIALAQRTLKDARRAVWDLRSSAVSGGDLPAIVRTAAEDCVRGSTVELEYDVDGAPRPVDPVIEAVVVRVAQEAISNVVKHADVQTVRVKLSFGRRQVRLSVIDDGRGFAVASDFHDYGGHWGLLGMRERASQVQGKFSVRSAPGQGTDVVLLVPCAPAVVGPRG